MRIDLTKRGPRAVHVSPFFHAAARCVRALTFGAVDFERFLPEMEPIRVERRTEQDAVRLREPGRRM